MDVKVPFFLDFSKKDEIQKNLQKEFKEFKQEQSKILRNERDKHLLAEGSLLDLYL